MQAVAFEIIDGIKVVRAFGAPTIDPELTKIEARKRLATSEQFRTFDRAYTVCAGLVDASLERCARAASISSRLAAELADLQAAFIKAHPVYFYVPGEENVTDDRADALRAALGHLAPRELLALDGSIVPDHRDHTAWKLEAARWVHVKITKLGDELPAGYQWGEDLTPEELGEIHQQAERDRIEAMSADERRAAADVEIGAAADALARQHARAQICGEDPPLDDIRAMFGAARKLILDKYKLNEVHNVKQPGPGEG
jgi:hypothetical protein